MAHAKSQVPPANTTAYPHHQGAPQMTLEARATDDFTSSTQWKVHDLARMAMNQCDGDPTFAAQKLYEWAMDDSGIYFTLTSHLIWNACKQATNAESRKNRGDILRSADRRQKCQESVKKVDENFGGKRLDSFLTSVMLKDCPLPGGKKLRYANADELYYHGTRQIKQGQNMVHTGTWWVNISHRLEGGIVDDELTEGQLQELLDNS